MLSPALVARWWPMTLGTDSPLRPSRGKTIAGWRPRRDALARTVLAASGLFLASVILRYLDHDTYRIDLTKVGGPLDVIAGFCLVFLCGALGWALVGRHLSRTRMHLSLLATCVAVGVVGVGTLSLGLAWAGIYRPIPLIVLVLVFAAGSIRYAPGLSDVIRHASRRVRRLGRGPVGAAWLGVHALGLGALLVLALTPISNWDSLMYHLDLPIEFLESGKAFLPVDNIHLSFLSVVQFAYGLPLAAGLPHAVNVLTVVGFGLFVGVMTDLGLSFGGLRGGAPGGFTRVVINLVAFGCH